MIAPLPVITQTKNNSPQSPQPLSQVLPETARTPMLLSNWIEAARATPRGRNKFSYWPVCVACAVVLTSRKPLEAQRWFPFEEEDRREDLQFELIIADG
jgi:hypothetical protein